MHIRDVDRVGEDYPLVTIEQPEHRLAHRRRQVYRVYEQQLRVPLGELEYRAADILDAAALILAAVRGHGDYAVVLEVERRQPLIVKFQSGLTVYLNASSAVLPVTYTPRIMPSAARFSRLCSVGAKCSSAMRDVRQRFISSG